MKTSKTSGKAKLVMFLLFLLMACEKEAQIEINQEDQPKIDIGLYRKSLVCGGRLS